MPDTAAIVGVGFFLSTVTVLSTDELETELPFPAASSAAVARHRNRHMTESSLMLTPLVFMVPVYVISPLLPELQLEGAVAPVPVVTVSSLGTKLYTGSLNVIVTSKSPF